MLLEGSNPTCSGIVSDGLGKDAGRDEKQSCDCQRNEPVLDHGDNLNLDDGAAKNKVPASHKCKDKPLNCEPK